MYVACEVKSKDGKRHYRIHEDGSVEVMLGKRWVRCYWRMQDLETMKDDKGIFNFLDAYKEACNRLSPAHPVDIY